MERQKHTDPNITKAAQSRLDKEVKNQNFQNDPPQSIHHALLNGLERPKFGDYLRRYICRKLDRIQEYATMDTEEYLQYIIQSFAKSGTPASFDSGTTTLRAIAQYTPLFSILLKIWLLVHGQGTDLPEKISSDVNN